MFTGIIQAVGSVVSVEPRGGDVRLHISTGALDVSSWELGDSISTSGVCLTVVDLPGDGYVADVSAETLSLTTIGQWQAGARVNLEPAMLPMTRFGGHIVSGHIDGVGEVLRRKSDARSECFRLKVPDALAKYIAHKGSIAIDGTSLTINTVEGSEFEINIVPHTLDNTVINDYQSGTLVNLEVDVVARYLERLLLGDKAAEV